MTYLPELAEFTTSINYVRSSRRAELRDYGRDFKNSFLMPTLISLPSISAMPSVL